MEKEKVKRSGSLSQSISGPGFHFACVVIILSLLFSGCDAIGLESGIIPAVPTAEDIPLADPLPPLPETLVNFIVEIPANTPPEQTIYLTALDEVTGLALNVKVNPMEEVVLENNVPGSSPRIFILTLPAAIGSMIQYRYERQAGSIRALEHLPDGAPVHYRLLRVDGPAIIRDVVSRWTDTPFMGLTGRISGQANEAGSGQPIPGLLVTAAGAQTFTAADGSFSLDGLPPGTHNLVALSIDGKFQSFQQGALVASGSDTPAPFQLAKASQVSVVFVVKVPDGTPPVVPLRLAGSLLQLGNTFASLNGGVNTLASRMPVMSQLPDGRYLLTVELPVGADIRYKYTLGDGFWNAEHTSEGTFRLRQAVIPPYNVIIEDQVETWYAGEADSLTFDVTVPQDTPAGDFISIQFSPLFGWTEPVPMWHLGDNRWGYLLYSPLNLPGNISYRYCRNDQCGIADDAETPGLFGKGRLLRIDEGARKVQDQVESWLNPPDSSAGNEIPTAEVQPRGASFWAGVEFEASYLPTWKSRLPGALQEVKDLDANWLVLAPTWSYLKNDNGSWLPRLNLLPSQDILWPDLAELIGQAKGQGLSVALNPAAHFPGDPENWWNEASLDAAWWETWFAQYRRFALHFAGVAQNTGSGALILGGEWLQSALPSGTLPDGSPSGVPADAAQRWRTLLDEVHSQYSGTVLWALPLDQAANPPPFLDAVDQIYLTYTISAADQVAAANGQSSLRAALTGMLDGVVAPLQQRLGKPFILALAAPANAPDAQAQLNSYAIALQAASQREWISGFVSRGYYPPAALLDAGFSIHGSPVSELLRRWYPTVLTNQ